MNTECTVCGKTPIKAAGLCSTHYTADLRRRRRNASAIGVEPKDDKVWKLRVKRPTGSQPLYFSDREQALDRAAREQVLFLGEYDRADGSFNEAAERGFEWFATLRHRGIDLTGNAHLKVGHEAAEFAEDPSLEEAADVAISLLGAMSQRGWTLRQLAEAMQLKLAVNEKREWAQLPDGTYQHVERMVS